MMIALSEDGQRQALLIIAALVKALIDHAPPSEIDAWPHAKTVQEALAFLKARGVLWEMEFYDK